MTRTYRILLSAALGCVISASPVLAQSAVKPPVAREIVNLFPVQSWAVLGAASAPVADMATSAPVPPSAPPPALPPFELVGQWWDETGRVVVLERQDSTYLLCDAPCAARGAIRPGERIVQGYRLKALTKQAVTIVADDGKVLELPLMELKS